MDLTGSNPSTNSVVIIPARFDSTRLPGKALLEIAGKPMICHVIGRALAARNVSNVMVATDDQRILDVVHQAGYEAVRTSPHHASGTDRIAEVALLLPHADIVVNVQGDEPLISPRTIDQAIEELVANEDTGIVTTWERIQLVSDILSPNVVKIIVDDEGRVLYFSRAPVPFPRDDVQDHGTIEAALNNNPSLVNSFRKHTGLYVYRRDVLLDFARWQPTQLERIESLEQLRPLEHAVKIRAIEAESPSIGVDTFADLQRVRKIMAADLPTLRGQL